LEEQKSDLRPAPSQMAAFILKTKPLQIEARLEVTPSGLLAIGALVGSILFATAAVVRSAKSSR
jgi:hypothetical protein